jgi:RNA polymerase sigma factor (sigma-70 family)
MTGEQQALARKYLPLARSLAKPMKKAWPNEHEEFDSAAQLALVEAAQSFDPTRNVKFSTFARYRIGGALRDVQRGLIAAGWRGDLENAPTLTSLTHDSELCGRVLNTTYDRPAGEEDEAVEYVESCLRKLPKKHAAACREVYLNGKTQAEAAEAIGCSKSRLSYLHKEGLEMIKEARDYEEARLARKSLRKPGY